MAQFGRALRSGRRGRKFESCHADLLILGWTVTIYFILEHAHSVFFCYCLFSSLEIKVIYCFMDTIAVN